MNKNTENELPELVYPVYLNVPMMTSFIAAIEDGIAFEFDRTTTSKEGREKTAASEGGFKLAEALTGFLGIDIKGQLAQKSNTMEEEAIKALRRHTEASLFIKFRQFLIDCNLLMSVDYADEEQCMNLQRGELIEVTGILGRDFLQDAILLFEQMLPYVDTNSIIKTSNPSQNTARGSRHNNQIQARGVNQPQDPQIEQMRSKPTSRPSN